MMNTLEDMLCEAFGTIATQCKRVSESALRMDAKQVNERFDALKKAVGFLRVIEQYMDRTA